MSAMQQKKSYDAPTGGLQDRYSPLMINPDEANELQNFVVNDRGILDKVKGYQKDGSPFPNSTDSFIRMLINYKRGTTVDKLIMAAQDNGNTNATYKVDYKATSGDGTYAYIGHTAGTNASFTNASTAVTGVGTTWLSHLKAGDKIKATAHTDAMYTEIASVTNDTNLVLVAGGYLGATAATVAYTARLITNKANVPRAIVFNNKCIITNGSDSMMTYDNTTLNLITDVDAPKPKFIEPHKSRVFTVSTTSNPSRLQWSAVNDESAWDATSIEDVYPNDNGNVIGIKSFADSLIVFKNNGNIYQVVGEFDEAVGEPDFIRKIDVPENIGIISERSIVVHTDGIYFLTETGMYRLDPRLYVAKVSYEVDNLLETVSFALGPSASKSVIKDTKTEWDNGTYTGTKASTTGTLSPKFTYATLTDATKRAECLSMAMDSSEVLHLAYLDSANPLIIRYTKIDTEGTVTTEVASTSVDPVYALALAVAPNGTVGIAWTMGDMSSVTNGTLPDAKLSKIVERISGVWGASSNIHGSTPTLASDAPPDTSNNAVSAIAYTKITSISLEYNTSNDPKAIICGAGHWLEIATPGLGTLSRGYYSIEEYHKRISGSWSKIMLRSSTYSTSGSGVGYNAATASATPVAANTSLLLSSDQPKLSYVFSTNLRAYSSTDLGVSFTNTENFAVSVTGKTQIQLNAAGNLITGFVDSATGAFKARNHTTAATSTIDSNTTSYAIGYIVSGAISADQSYAYNITGSSPTAVEKATFETSSSITNSVNNIVDKTVLVGAGCMSAQGRVFGMCAYGVSANNIAVRRMAFRSNYKSNEQSDATLTQWGTFDVVSTPNSGTITYTGALSNIDQGSDPLPDGSYTATLTNGNIISTDTTKVFFSVKVEIVLGDFASPEVDSITLNYTGTGVDAKQPVAISFDNELYTAVATTSDTANAQIVFYDKEAKWAKFTHPVSAMCRYKNKLYAGKATNGDLIILRQSFKFDTSAYTASFISKEDFLDSIDLEKDIFKIYVLYEVKSAGSFTFAYRLDSFKTSGGSTWKSKTVDQTSLGIDEVHVGNKAHTIQFRIQNTNSDQECSVIGFVVVYGMLNQR